MCDVINPLLQQGDIYNQKMIGGKRLFEQPANISFVTLEASWSSYGVAWILASPSKYAAAALLGLHVVLAIVHTVTLLIRGESSSVWNSSLDMIMLAWNSTPQRRDQELLNCSGGVRSLQTLRRKARIVTVEEPEKTERMEIVLVDNKGKDMGGRTVRPIEPEVAYK